MARRLRVLAAAGGADRLQQLPPGAGWFYDTGAALYEELRFRRERLFVGLPARFAPRFATHFSGVSRHVVQGGGTPIAEIAATVIERLRTVYGVDAAG